MKKKALIITSAVLGAVALTFTSLFIWKAVAPTNTQPAGTHKVTWVDENDNVLEVDYTMDGETPEYNGEKPASYDTEIDKFGEKYRYAFNGWNHDLVPVTEDVTYKAVMKAHSLVTKVVLNTPEDDNSVYRYFSYVGELEKVDWGDGTIDRNVAHAYDTPTSQKVTIRIYGEMTELHFAYDYCAFDGIYACKGIDSIHLSYSITCIPDASMEDINMDSHSAPLQKIFIPASVKFIGDEALYLDTNGTVLNVEFEEGMELDYLGTDCFLSESEETCYKSFTFGKNMIIHNICYHAFENSACSTFDFADGTRIDHIESGAFGEGYSDVPVSVSFGNNCVLGDLYLRPDNPNLPRYMEQLSFGNNCYIHALNTSIGSMSITWNDLLKSVTFGDNCYIETFGSFSNFTALNSIQFGENTFVENMNADYMFANCNELVSLIFPEQIGTELGSYTFNYSTQVSYISLPKNIKFIPDHFADNCNNLFSITIPQSVEHIGAYAFDSIALEEVIFEEGSHLKSIGIEAFWGLTSSELKIELPEGLESIQSEAFQQTNLDQIKIPKSVKFIDSCAFDNSNLSSIEFAEDSNLVSLGEYALQGTNIKTLVLPNKLESAGYELCMQCQSLEYVKLPASLKYLGYGAFSDCSSLVTADLTALSDLPLTDAGMGNEAIFNNCNQPNLTIYVSNQTVYDKLTSEEGEQTWGDLTVVIGEAPQPEM